MSWPKISTLIMEGLQTVISLPQTGNEIINCSGNHPVWRALLPLSSTQLLFFILKMGCGHYTLGNSLLPGHYPTYAEHCLDFSFVFSSPLLAWRNLFSASGIFCGEGTSQAVLGSSDQRKVPAIPSLFPKSEKIRALLYLGKGPEYRLFHDLRPVPSAYCPRA